MSLRIIAGRAGSGKSSIALQELAHRLSQQVNSAGLSTYYLVPEQFTLQAERRLLSHPNCPGLLQNEVLSFKRMAFRVLNQTGGLRRKRLAPSGRVMLLMKVLGECASFLHYYRDLKERPWEAGKLLGLLDEFGRYQVTPDLLEEIGKTPELDSTLRAKCADLSLIYTSYRRLLTEDFADEEDLYTALIDRLRRYRPFAGAEIWVDEFAGFTPMEFDILRELLGQCSRVTVCLCLDFQDPLFHGVQRSYERLLELADEAGVFVETQTLSVTQKKGRFEQNPYLAHIESQFCSYPSKPLSGIPQGITVRECKTLLAEVEASAREILRLCREQALSFGDIAVTARQLESYEGLIQAVYPRYGIPFFMDSKKAIESHPLVRIVLDSLLVIGEDWTYESVFGVLKTDLYPADPALVDCLENVALATGLQGRKRWHHSLDASVDPAVEELREHFVARLDSLRQGLKESKTIRDACLALCSYLSDLGLRERLDQEALCLEQEHRREEASETRRIWNMVMEVMEQLVHFLGSEPLGRSSAAAERLRILLLGGFSQYRAGKLPQSVDGVQVGTADRSRTTAVQALLVLGANEGKFPATFTDDGLLSDHDRETFQRCGIRLADDNRTRARLEHFLIYRVLTTPTRFLHVSYALEDASGAAMRPSFLVRRLFRLFPHLTLCRDYLLSAEEKLTAPGPFFMNQASWICHTAKAMSPLQTAICHWYEQSQEWGPLYRRMLANQGRRTKQDGLLLDPNLAEQLFRLQGTPFLTVSRIESYNRCPFSFYLLYGFQAKPRKEYEMAIPDMGTFVHKLIDKASHLSVSEGRELSTLTEEECHRFIDCVTEDALAEMGTTAFTGSARNRYMTERLQRFAQRALTALSGQLAAGHFQASGFEASFGMEEGDFPAVPVHLDNGRTVLLRGRIDRYDVMEKDGSLYVRVVDYKSSDREISPGDVVTGMKIQLVTYLEALHRGLAKREQKPVVDAAALYFTLKEDWCTLEQHPDDTEMPGLSYKMNGFLLNDSQVLLSMVEENPGESVASIRVKKDGEASVSSSSGAVPPGGFAFLFDQVHQSVRQSVQGMYRGDISVLPRVSRESCPCDYCEYAAVCGRMGESHPPSLNVWKPSAEQVWEKGGLANASSQSASS